MKITTLLLFVTFMQLHASLLSQVTLVEKNASLTKVLKEIQKQSGCDLLYSYERIQEAGNVTVDLHDVSLEDALNECLRDKPLEYSILENTIIIKPKTGPNDMVLLTAADQQKNVVTGKVVDDKGEPMPGVAVTIKGKNIGVSTLNDGTYSIQLPADAKYLVFSLIGMKQTEVEIAGKILINVQLSEEVQQLSEVIATGYQTISKERASGSYVILDMKKIDNKPVSNISASLYGLSPGVTQQTTADGSFSRFLIRGQGTFQGVIDRDPLIVVDGFAIQGVSMQGTGLNFEKDPFASINPNDVESITVLKDAAATSIYGARAGNGVIVITTKKGKKGEKVNINVSSFVSVMSKPDLEYTYNMASGSTQKRYLENLEKYSLQYNDSWKDPYYSTTNPFVYLSKGAELLHEYKRKNNLTQDQYNTGFSALLADEGKWQDEYNKYLFRKQVTQQYNLNINGNSEKNNYSFSVVYDKELSTSIGNERNRVILNLSDTYEIVKDLTVSVGINTQLNNNSNAGVGITELMSFTSPWSRLKNDDGSFATFPINSTMYEPIYRAKYLGKVPANWRYNPLEERDARESNSQIFNYRVQAGLNYKIIEGLNISLKGQYENNTYNNQSLNRPESFTLRTYRNTYSNLNTTTGKYVANSSIPAGGILSSGGDKFTSYNFRGQLDYNKTFAEKHEVTSLIGAEVLSSTTNSIPRYTRYGYNENTNSVMTYPDYMTRVKNIFGIDVFYPYAGLPGLSTFEDRFTSAYFNAAYTYDHKYSISTSLRSDASNFISDEVKNKISPFYSVGGAWNISREDFMENAQFFDNLKLRGSYGSAGVAAGKRNISTLTTVSVGAANITATNNEPYNSIALRGNPSLTWEKSRTANIGIDFSMFKSKLYGTLEYYNRHSFDVLAPAPVPYIAQSIASATYNNAEIANNGFEMALGSGLNITDKIRWTGDLNFSYNKTSVLEHLAIPVAASSYYGNQVYYPGRPITAVYAYNLIGYTPEGYPKLEGKNGVVEIVKDRATTHYYDVLNGAAGETVENSNWLRYYGTSTPLVNAGFTNTFSLYNFTFSFLITGKFAYLFKRNDVPSNNQTSGAYAKTLEKAFEVNDNGYKGPYTELPIYNDANAAVFNTGFAYPYMTVLHYASEAMLEKGDQIRLNEIYLGYDFKNTLIGADSGIKRLTVYAQARSLGLLWTANKLGIDPDYLHYSVKPMPTFTFGFKLDF